MPRYLSSPPPPPPFVISAADPPPNHATSASSSAVIVVIVISSAIIASASIYLLLRLRCRRRTFSVSDDVIVTTQQQQHHHSSVDTSATDLISSLPAFTFGSVTGNLTGGDCAVCLSKFERSDQLRLLPLCCHAFHAQCVDTWLLANQTCPLCRSTIHPAEDDVLNKILHQSANERSSSSFRIEIGSISRRRGDGGGGDDSADRRSYSVGDFDYIVDNGYEVPIESMTHRRGISDDKEISHAPSSPEIPLDELAAGVGSGSGRSWLRDYVDRLGSISSRTISFRGSGRFFGGSGRRSEAAKSAEDMEEYRVGEEISELFRWLSGV